VPVLELDAVAAPHSVSALDAAFEQEPGAGPGAAAGMAGVTVVVTAVVGLEAAAGFGADSELEFVPAEVEPLPVEALPGDSTVPSHCPAPDMAPSTPSVVGVGVVGPVVLVVTVTEVVLGVEAEIGIALPHKRDFDPDWCVGQDAAVHK
jgi:hypothetical protein